MSDEAVVKDSKYFNFAAPGEPEELRDAWGRPAEEDEPVDFAPTSKYKGMKVDGDDGLKAELKRREEAGRTFDKSQIKTKADLVAALDADDRAQAAEAAADDNDPDE